MENINRDIPLINDWDSFYLERAVCVDGEPQALTDPVEQMLNYGYDNPLKDAVEKYQVDAVLLSLLMGAKVDITLTARYKSAVIDILTITADKGSLQH